MVKAYLAGAINGQPDSAAKGWRETATQLLDAQGMVALDPMRRDYRGIEDRFAGSIFQGDMEDIIACDVVIVRATAPSWGTAMELVYARILSKPVIAFDVPARPSPWLVMHTAARVASLDEAVSIAGRLAKTSAKVAS